MLGGGWLCCMEPMVDLDLRELGVEIGELGGDR